MKVNQLLKKLCQAVLDALFPPRCPVCRQYVDAHGTFCGGCYNKIIHVRRVPLDTRYINALDFVYVLTNYHAGMKMLIHSVKYQKKFTYLLHINRILQQETPEEIRGGIDCLMPVPLHPCRLEARGFNQTEKIYFRWAKDNGFFWLDGLERCKNTLPQYELKLKQRQENMTKAFIVKEQIDVRGKNVLLVDDIFTTGLTMDACAKALRQAGAKRVVGLALASDA